MLQALTDAGNTAITATPWMVAAVTLMNVTGPRMGPIDGAIATAIAGGVSAAVWEHTWNRNSHPAELKWGVITGTAAIGGAVGAVAGLL